MSRRGRGLTGAAESRPRSGSPSVAPKDLAADSSFRRVTRNYTEAYVARRALFREDTKRRMTHIAARKAKLAFDKRAELEERKKQSSWRNSLGWGRADDAILPVADDSHSQAPNCRLCGASFMALVRKRYKCPLCELAVCGTCFNQKIQLDPVIFTDLPITEVICKACYALVQEEEERATIAKAIETAPEQPLVYYHRVVMEVVRTLSRHLPRYESSVLAADSVADCEEAGKVETSLVELFKNFDIGVKKITAMKFESEKETRVQNSVKMALIGFLQENLARFRTLQNQRKGLLAQFIEDEKSGTKRKSHRKQNAADGGQHGSGPFIATIDPAMSPMAGTKLTFTGTNFKSGTKVEIAGISCRIKFMGPDRLIVYSPALESEGLKNVLITNPSGESHKLENVLLYSDEYFRLTQADRRQQDGASSAGHETKRSSSDEGSGKRADVAAASTTAATVPSRSVSSPAISGGAPLAIDEVVANSKVPLEDPVIRLIHPAICPVGGGTTLRLTGNHFCNQSAVRIGGKDAPVLHFSDLAQGESQSQQLEVRSPRLAKVGFHAVEVVNPGGKRYRLDDVL